MSETVTMTYEEVQELFTHLREIVQTLERVGMVDTAKEIRNQANRLVVDPQSPWEL